MKDPRLSQLAEILVDYSNSIRKGERVLLITYGLQAVPLAKEVYRLCIQRGAHVRYEIRDEEFTRLFYENAEGEQLDYLPPYAAEEAHTYDAMFQLISDRNSMELAHIDQAKMTQKSKATKIISDILHEKRWVLFEYPTAGSAQNAGMSLEAWEDFVFQSCLIDWEKASKELDQIKSVLEKVREIRLEADGTDLTVDVTGQNWIKCCGKQNMPDGEIFSSPHRDKVNGTITFNTPTMYRGKSFDTITLEFQDGKVVSAKSDKNLEGLLNILDTDEGARYLGEFAFGTNRKIQSPVKSILFDEKIGGSNHMALGKCYAEAPNGNDSMIHWDLILRHEKANGKVYFDGELVQECGIWKHPELTRLNP